MLHSFFGLITKRACGRVWQVALGETICRPTTVVDVQPNKKFAAQRSPRFPSSSPGGKFGGSKKECFVS
uniref:Uncharacterized protein n=1 Tax=Arundo donax TaxID=35708 RepID=A0A0A8Z9V2_ARUDO